MAIATSITITANAKARFCQTPARSSSQANREAFTWAYQDHVAQHKLLDRQIDQSGTLRTLATTRRRSSSFSIARRLRPMAKDRRLLDREKRKGEWVLMGSKAQRSCVYAEFTSPLL